jgi:IS5 family transposase
MKQKTFSDMEYSGRKKTTRWEKFFDAMDGVIPWDEWVDLIQSHYPDGKRGRPTMGVEKMLRMYLLQCWFNLSDEGVEDAIYDSYAMRKFMRINFADEQVPDATTLLKFRRIMEEFKIDEQLFRAINYVMEQSGYIMRGGTISAPPSTKNAEKARDPEMHQPKKGNEWHFGMKTHIGVDAGSGLVHTIEVTAANIHDVCVASDLIREDDEVVYGDSGYLGIQKRDEIKENPHLSSIEYRINRRPGSLPVASENAFNWDKFIENRKSSVRCKVEHAFKIVKCDFGYRKVRYRGLAKNENRLNVLFACANLLMCVRAGRFLRPAKG